jgi:cbb3-type cytochrome oxidase subunit 3
LHEEDIDLVLKGVDVCMNSSFAPNGLASKNENFIPNYDKDDNVILRDMQKEWNQLGVHLYPSVAINN